MLDMFAAKETQMVWQLKDRDSADTRPSVSVLPDYMSALEHRIPINQFNAFIHAQVMCMFQK